MIIIANNTKYRIRFQYGPNRLYTQCFITNSETNQEESSFVYRHLKDPDNKAEARRFALAKTLKKLTTDKGIRRQFWIGYSSQIRESFPVQ